MRTPHTIRWLFDMQAYKDWVEGSGEQHRNLQCIGMPGAGKTVLASAVIEDLENRPSTGDTPTSRNVMYVYFKHDKQPIQTRKFVLANLLSQLVQRKEHPPNTVLALFKEYLHNLTLVPGPEKTINVLKSEIARAAGVKTYIVVDALDEFSLDDPSSAMALVGDLEELGVRLLVTSRYDISFKHASKIEVSASKADIQMFIEQQISSSARLEKFIARSPELRSEIVKEVTAKSQGMFLITRFLMNWICDLLKLSDVKKALRNLPSGTDAMHTLTMDRVEDQRDDLKRLATSAVSWVLLAKRRLRVRELQHVVAFELQDGSEMADDDDVYELEDIISASAGLIICVGEEVQFVHFSIQEFLSKNCDRYFAGAKLRVMETCLKYLVAVTHLIPDELRHSDNPHQKALEYFRDYPFADYASSQLGFHASDVDGHEQLNVQLVDEFLSHPLSLYVAFVSSPQPYSTRTSEIPPIAYIILFFATFGLCSLLKRCIDRHHSDGHSNAADLEVHDKHGRTPLFFSVTHNHIATVKLLLAHGADLDARDEGKRTPLHCAAAHGHREMITTLLEHGAVIHAKDRDGETPIFAAVGEGRLEAVKLLIEKGADINIPNNDGQTILHRASYLGQTDIVVTLLERGVDINSLDEDGATPLFSAVEREEMKTAKLLIEKGADIHICNGSGQTLLHQAAYWGYSDIATILLDKRIDINSSDEEGNTPIFTAVEEQQLEIVKLLIEKGADTSLRNESGETLLHRVAYRECSEISTCLLENGIDMNALDEDGRTPIWIAFEEREWKTVMMFIKKGVDVNIRNKDGQTLLHRAVYRGQSDIVTLLLDRGTDVNSLDEDGRTPVFIALEHRKWKTAKLLIKRGADVNIADKKGQTLLHRAAHEGNLYIATILLEEGIDIDSINGDGHSPIWIAAERRQWDMMRLFIDKGATIHIPDNVGDFLHQAAYQGLSGIVTSLLDDHGSDVNMQDAGGRTLIFSAAEGGHADVLKLLLVRKADPSIRNHGGETPLHGAAREGQTDALAVLLDDLQVHVNAKNNAGKTPLLTAMKHEQIHTAGLLIKRGANTSDFASFPVTNFSYDNLDALLRWASYYGCIEAMELLVKMGTSLDETDDYQNGVATYAAAGHALEALHLLIRQGSVQLDKPNDKNRAPLSYAIDGGHFDVRDDVPDSERTAVVRMLLQRGADTYREDDDGETPLSRARECIWPEIRELVEQCADVSQRYVRGEENTTRVSREVISQVEDQDVGEDEGEEGAPPDSAHKKELDKGTKEETAREIIDSVAGLEVNEDTEIVVSTQEDVDSAGKESEEKQTEGAFSGRRKWISPGTMLNMILITVIAVLAYMSAAPGRVCEG